MVCVCARVCVSVCMYGCVCVCACFFCFHGFESVEIDV